MASGQQRLEHNVSSKQGETGGTRDNNLQRLAEMHRGGRTKGEDIGTKGYEESKGYQEMGHEGDQTNEQHGTESNKEVGRGGAGGARTVDEEIDIDESTG